MKSIIRFSRFILASLIISSSILTLVPVFADAATVSVWWPENNASVSGVQPFKALVDGSPLSDYSMYWQVDNGELNPMSDNTTDAPHKEASVDLSGWHWQPSGSYQINIVAKDQSGNTIGQAARTIYTNQNQNSTQPSASSPASAPAPTTATSVSAPVAQPVISAPSYSAPSAQISAAVTSSSAGVNIWWPKDAVHVSGTQPFKAVVSGLTLSSYSIYWQVDNGQLNKMSDSSVDGDHKESLVDVSSWKWNSSGPYELTFIAKDSKNKEISRAIATIYVDQYVTAPAPTLAPASTSTPATTTNAQPTPQTVLINEPPTAPISTPVVGDPLSGMSFYADPNSNAANQVTAWQSSRPADAAEIQKIASEPAAKWLGGWNSNVYSDTKSYTDAAAAKSQVPVFIVYNIPFRDCGGYSAGGATTAADYQSWIDNVANGIGNRQAVVVVEPDGLASADCLSTTDKATRYSLLAYAVSSLKAKGNIKVYLDAGNSNWISASDMATRLKSAGIASADGFALDVSNYYWTQDNVNYGAQVSSQVGGKHFVVDTSRNGLGPNGSQWCNPSGRALGPKVTTSTGNPLADGFLWLKLPGESDGACNGGPAAGAWWGDYALGLAQRAAY